MKNSAKNCAFHHLPLPPSGFRQLIRRTLPSNYREERNMERGREIWMLSMNADDGGRRKVVVQRRH
jgi:hypothetical protein